MAGNQRAFEDAMNKGHSAAWDQRWDQAAQFYRIALGEFPDHSSALTNLALALFEMEEFDEALKIYKRAAILSPDDPIAPEKMARIFERQGRLNEAIRAGMQAAELHLKSKDVEKSIEGWLRVLSLNPENLTAHSRLAMIYERLGKKGEAVAELLASASLMQHAGEIQKATQIVLYALKLLPGSAEASQALHLIRSGQPLPKPIRPRGGTGPMRMAEVRQLEAPHESGKPALMDPLAEARQRALVQLAGLLFDQPEELSSADAHPARRGINALMRGTGELSLDQSLQTRLLLHIGQAIESQTMGQEKQAAEELERAYEIGFSHPALHYDLGLLLAEKRDSKALQVLLKAVKHPDFALASYLLMGKIYLRTGNLKDAALSCLQALRLADAETVPPAHRPELYQMYEPIIEAQEHVTDPKALQALCDTVCEQLMRSDWRDFLNRARQQLPPQEAGAPPALLADMLLESRSSEVIEALGRIRMLAQQGKTHTALEEAYHAIDFAPTYLPLHSQIAELLLQDGLLHDAISKYLLVIELYSLRGEAAQAISLLRRVTQISPVHLGVRQQLIKMLIEQGQVDEALQQYLEVADIYYRLAELDKARHTYLDALKLVQQSRRTRQWAFQLLNHLADIDMQRLDWRQALRFFEQMRTLQPDDQVLRERIVELNFRLGQDKAALLEVDNFLNYLEGAHRRDTALAFVNSLLFEQPEKFELRLRLADLYTKNQKPKEAVAELDVVADAYVETNEYDSAVKVVEQIIRLNPPNRAEYEAALVKLRAAQR
ncbi:MAG: tetratricopeptide repeat protein [Chloroflexota bacterium]|jgi:tetratricopeptide (TPR) repeat protein